MENLPELQPIFEPSQLNGQDILLDWHRPINIAIATPTRLALNLLVATSEQEMFVGDAIAATHTSKVAEKSALKGYVSRLAVEGMVEINTATLSATGSVINDTVVRSTEAARHSLPLLGVTALSVMQHRLPLRQIIPEKMPTPYALPYGRAPLLRACILQSTMDTGMTSARKVATEMPEATQSALFRNMTDLTNDEILVRHREPGVPTIWYSLAEAVRPSVTHLLQAIASLKDEKYRKDATKVGETIAADNELLQVLLDQGDQLVLSPDQAREQAMLARLMPGVPTWLAQRLYAKQNLRDVDRKVIMQRVTYLFQKHIVNPTGNDPSIQDLEFNPVVKLHLNPVQRQALARYTLLERRLGFRPETLPDAEMKMRLGLRPEDDVRLHVQQVLMPKLRAVFG